eukprot:Pgem_evm2s19810
MNLKVLCILIFGILCVNSARYTGFIRSKYKVQKTWTDFKEAPESSKLLPIVIWHGLGGYASSFDNFIHKIKFHVREQLFEYVGYELIKDRGVSFIDIHTIKIGETRKEQVHNSFFMDANKQVELACEQLRQNKALENGFIAIGFSQGGNFFRGVVERCGHYLKIYNLITLASQHQGIARVPALWVPKGSWGIDNVVNGAVNRPMFTKIMQNKLAPAGYWHGLNEKDYLEGNTFLTDINNVKTEKNPLYKKNLLKLNTFAMVKMTNDKLVDPPESSHFGYYDPNDPNKIQKLKETSLYKDDYLGLKQLDLEGRLKFLEFQGHHTQLFDPREFSLFMRNLSEELFVLEKMVDHKQWADDINKDSIYKAKDLNIKKYAVKEGFKLSLKLAALYGIKQIFQY